jgi:hypothetical protein
MTLITTTIEEIVNKLTPEVIGEYKNAEDRQKYVENFCQENYRSRSGGLHILVDRLIKNAEHSLPIHGLIIPISEE